MSEPIGQQYLNNAIFPNQLVQGTAVTWQNVPSSQFVIRGAMGQPKYLSRIILTTTLNGTDMVGGPGGAYWNTSLTPPVQAPFYLFVGSVALSNLVDLSLIGSVNVGQELIPLKIPENTDLYGMWQGVIPASAEKCEATLCFVSPRGI